MSNYLDDFACLYAADMPGVVAVTLPASATSSSEASSSEGAETVIQAQFWSEPELSAEGFIALHATRQRLQAPTARFGALRRGDQVEVGGKTYHCVTGPVDDGHGIADVYLEPVA